jgi:ABC-2 type transport system permease protein
MRTTFAIFRKELKAYFDSPIGYIFIAAFLLLNGGIFFTRVFLEQEASLRAFFSFASITFVAFAPLISMRLIAEEKKSGTIEVLSTMPLREHHVVIGKYLAALSVLGIALLFTLPYAWSIASIGKLDWGPVIGGYVGLLLCGGAYLAIGLLASAWTKNQIVALLIALPLSIFFFLAGNYLPVIFGGVEFLGNALQYSSTSFHFENVARGVLDTRDLIYYVTFIAACLLLCTQSLAARRWR